MTRDDKAAYAAAKDVRHSKCCATPITVTLEVYGRDIIARINFINKIIMFYLLLFNLLK